MDTAPASFDWIAWYASIPGIASDWGQPTVWPAQAAPIERFPRRTRRLAVLPPQRKAA